MTPTLKGKTIVMSGGSRGIGLAIALRAAGDGANIVMLAKTGTPDPRLSGTIHSAVEAIHEAGGQAAAVVGDVRDDSAIARTIATARERFGAIDICINNASVLTLAGTLALEPKRYDLMQDVNTRGTFMLSRECIPLLLEAENPHILTLSPPINLSNPAWLAKFPGYLLSKYGMTLATIAMAAEFKDKGLAANTLWPRTTIATDAVKNLMDDESVAGSRRPEIMADAAYEILTDPSSIRTGQTLIDDEVLAEAGVSDLSSYATTPGNTRFETDFFLD